MPRRREPKPAMPHGRRGPPQPRPRLAPADRDRRLAEEVLYLHSLWRRGPPALVPIETTERKRKRPAVAARKAKSIELKRPKRAAAAAEPKDNGSEWPLAPSPPKSSPKTWSDAAPPSSSTPAKPPPQPPSPGARAQRVALRAAAEFLSNRGSDDDGDDGGSESEGEQDAKGFITGLFVRDAALRRHYERGWEEGKFQCLVCSGGRRRTKRFKGCVALVQHATAAAAATRYGRPRAHRALADVICRVLGWDIARLPSIVMDPRGTLGQAIAAEESDDTEEDDDSSDDEDEEEDDETEMEDSSTDGDEEDNECRNSEESAEKEAMEEISPSNCNEISKNEVLHNEPVQQDNAGKGDSLDQGHNGEVHKQEVAKESSEQENTNDAYPPDSKDTCKNEQCKEDAVQKA